MHTVAISTFRPEIEESLVAGEIDTDVTAPKGPNIAQICFSEASSGKLVTKVIISYNPAQKTKVPEI